MLKDKSILAVIPARSGSKGLPGKNTKIFLGKPLLVWTIEAALDCSFIDKVVVSTDCDQTAQIAIEAGALVPFVRPASLASDYSTSVDVIEHTLDFFEANANEKFDFTILLEPTSPLRDSQDIFEAMNKLLDSPRSKSLVGVSLTESQNPAFLFDLNLDGNISKYDNAQFQSPRRQDVQDVYFPEGSIYISETNFLRKTGTFFHEKTFGYVMPKWKSIEIDDIHDFIMCEALMRWKLT
jgi:CMP-N,N'-diacetyllegionaminic acid synthase